MCAKRLLEELLVEALAGAISDGRRLSVPRVCGEDLARVPVQAPESSNSSCLETITWATCDNGGVYAVIE